MNILRCCVVFFFLFSAANAAIIDTEEELTKAQLAAEAPTNGRSLKEEVLAGSIIFKDEIGHITEDQHSAVVIGLPGHKMTNSVLSCAHTYNDLLMGKYKGHPNFKMYFRSPNGRIYDIDETVLALSTSSPLNPETDIAVFRIKGEPISCNPGNVITSSLLVDVPLTTVTYGWTLTSNGAYHVGNTDGALPYAFTANFLPHGNTFYQKFEADRVVQVAKGEHSKSIYLAKRGSAPQIFHQDSGSAWFARQDKEGCTLAGITSMTSQLDPVDYFSLARKELKVQEEVDFNWLADPVKLYVYGINGTRPFINSLTSLAPHREWIYRQCK